MFHFFLVFLLLTLNWQVYISWLSCSDSSIVVVITSRKLQNSFTSVSNYQMYEKNMTKDMKKRSGEKFFWEGFFFFFKKKKKNVENEVLFYCLYFYHACVSEDQNSFAKFFYSNRQFLPNKPALSLPLKITSISLSFSALNLLTKCML